MADGQLEVTTLAPDGSPRVLQRRPGAPPRLPTAPPDEIVDEAGYPCVVYADSREPTWGTLLVLCKEAQSPFFDRWARAFVARGLEVRRYRVEQMWQMPQTQTGAHIRVEDTVGYSVFRWGVHLGEAVTQARGCHDATRQIIRAAERKPVAACMWGHSEHWQRAPARACQEFGVATLHFEGAMFPRLSHLQHGRALDPGHAIVNRGGQYYEDASDIDAVWRAVRHEPLTDARELWLDTYLGAWCNARASKYGQAEAEAQIGAEDGRRVLFVPLQIDRDASLYHATAMVKTSRDLVEAVNAATSAVDWAVVVKPHPHDSVGHAHVSSEVTREGSVRVVHDANIHDCLRAADAVCGINSTVLLEACCYDRPAVCLGSSCFTGKGFTYDVRRKRALEKTLWAESPLAFTDEMHERFRRFLYMMFWEGNGGNGFFVDIDNFDAGRLVG